MAKLSVSMEQYLHFIEELPSKVEGAVIDGLREAAAKGVGHVIEEIAAVKANDTGGLQQSVRSHSIPDGAILAVEAPHAVYVEKGTRPHMPPEGPIRLWVARKLGIRDEKEQLARTQAIRRAIAKNGTKPRRFFAKAMVKVNEDAPVIVKKHMRKKVKP